MPVVVVIPPAATCVSLALAKAHLRVDGDDEDVLIAQHIAAAQAAIDGPDGWLNRAVARQTLELRLADFDGRDRTPAELWVMRGGGWFGLRHERRAQIPLPCIPIVEVSQIHYLDGSGDDQALDPSVWRQTLHGVAPVTGQAWPCASIEAESVRIRYTAGYADGSVPPPIIQAVLLMVGDLYANREAVIIESGKTSVVLNPTAEALLEKYRWWTA